MDITKFISNQIEKQFPAIYREDGRELVDLVKEYYRFLETLPNQATFNSRRIFEYRDIDSTLESMLIFFKKKYLADLPFDESNIRFIVKNVLDLYRRKGSKEGIELFFRLFYNESVSVFYPATQVLRASDSLWVVDNYLQMYPADPNVFTALQGKRIIGSSSGAEAIVNRVVFILSNNTITPIVYLENIRGSFKRYETILSGGQSYGRIYGSMIDLEPVVSEFSTSGNQVGDILDCSCLIGFGGKALVTEVSNSFSGEISYDVTDGGFGYSVDNTIILTSEQTIITDNQDLKFTLFEYLEDQFGNRGYVVGQNVLSVAVKMDGNDFFTQSSVIQTTDRDVNVTVDFTNVSEKNTSSPGELVQIGDLDFPETIEIITDLIDPFLDVPLSANNFYDFANTVFSGNVSVANIDTLLEDVFFPETITIGRIRNLININPGTNYFNDVFSLAIDTKISPFNIKNQVITVDTANFIFSVGELVSQSGKQGIIRSVSRNVITITPFTFYGFNSEDPITYLGNTYNITSISREFSSRPLGSNAVIDAQTEFAVGKILGLKVINSGYGYIQDSVIRLKKSGTNEVVTRARVTNNGLGFNEGRWETKSSHIGAIDDRRIHDNFYYQEYSYDVKSKTDINIYENELKKVMHPSGIKLFGTFEFNDEVNVNCDVTSNILV
jgi:hypothetical protein